MIENAGAIPPTDDVQAANRVQQALANRADARQARSRYGRQLAARASVPLRHALPGVLLRQLHGPAQRLGERPVVRAQASQLPRELLDSLPQGPVLRSLPLEALPHAFDLLGVLPAHALDVPAGVHAHAADAYLDRRISVRYFFVRKVLLLNHSCGFVVLPSAVRGSHARPDAKDAAPGRPHGRRTGGNS